MVPVFEHHSILKLFCLDELGYGKGSSLSLAHTLQAFLLPR